MEIKTKYSIGEDVYVIFKEDDEVIRLSKDKIDSIVIKENEVVYFLDNICEEFHEDELIKYKDESSLLNKINILMENKICPKCNKIMKGYPAISREDNKTEICSICGQIEALETFHNSIGVK